MIWFCGERRDWRAASRALTMNDVGRATAVSGVISLGILGGILVAGLWPFHQPANAVAWLERENGVRFGRHGIVLSSITLRLPSADKSCSVEIWVRPGRPWQSGTLLALLDPGGPRTVSVHDDASDLVLKRDRVTGIDIDDVFSKPKWSLITIASASTRTAVYVDGVLARAVTGFSFCPDFDPQIVTGTSPATGQSWSGELRGLAIYGVELDALAVHSHYREWLGKGKPAIATSERLLALYTFNEGQGRAVRDRAGNGADLYIPERYSIPRQIFLEPFWSEFRPSRSYVKDVLINIAGFVPLGVWFYCYGSWIRPIRRAGLAAVILGALISLTIEVLQSYIPTRTSGTTDLITNTLGTYLGVLLCRSYAFGPLVRKILVMLDLTQ